MSLEGTQADVERFEQKLNDYVEAFESALDRNVDADVAEYLPAPHDADFQTIGVELLRVDLQVRWESNAAVSVDDYQKRFPQLLSSKELLGELAFEDYRMRRMSGIDISPDDYLRFDIETRDWPKVTDSTIRVRRNSASTVAKAGNQPPISTAENLSLESNDEHFGFRILCEIGQGAFAKVYLAKQQSLAGRNVVLKVSQEGQKNSPKQEGDRLARLQHTNIVPIYSLHSDDTTTAICMPDFGACTLRDVVRLIQEQSALPSSGQPFVDAVHERRSQIISSLHANGHTGTEAISNPLPRKAGFECDTFETACIKISLQIAEALRYAHAQHVVHCDLKPANVLLAEHGPAMLLDFNLSDTLDESLRSRSIVGGTLPYASPEHLEAIITGAKIGPESDVYSLGVILYELLTGTLPFATHVGSSDDVIRKMITDRQTAPPPAHTINPAVSRSMSDLLSRVLSPQRESRIESIGDICTDLQRHLDNRPLAHVPNRSFRERCSKWSARHPRLSSTTAVLVLTAVVSVGFLGALFVQRERQKVAEFSAAVHALEDALPIIRAYGSVPNEDPTMFKRGLVVGQGSLLKLEPFLSKGVTSRYQAPWLSALATEELATIDTGLALMESIADQLAAHGPIDDRAMYAELRDSYRSLRSDKTAPSSDLDKAIASLRDHRYDDAIAMLETYRDASPFQLDVWYLLGHGYRLNGQYREAEACFTTCAVMWQDVVPGYFCRGLCYLQRNEYNKAESDFTTVLNKDADHIPALINRAVARRELGNLNGAKADLDTAIELDAPQTRVFFMRSEIQERLGNNDAADDDFNEGIWRQPIDEQSFVRRGTAIMKESPDEAIADFQAAIKLNPRNFVAHRNWAYVVGERLKQPEAAIEILDRMLEWSTDPANELLSRAVMFGRMGKREDAIRDTEAAIKLRQDGKALFQAACVYSLLSESSADGKSKMDTTQAIHFVERAVQDDPRWRVVAKRDPDLNALRGNDKFNAIISR
ncbi:MAG: protein kinase [Planctomycetales bacterium]|nr:protein kinase [Planctomycetales bacterium]